MRLPKCNNDYFGGILMILVGLAAVFGGMRYETGTLADMGPGFFPSAVGVLLALTGLGIAATAVPSAEGHAQLPPPQWRGWACIVGGMIAFVVLGVHGGLIPATLGLVFIAALGDKRNTIMQALALAVAMAVVAAVVFRWGLQIQLGLFAWGQS